MTTIHHFDPPGPSPGQGIVPGSMDWYGKKAPAYCRPLTLEWFEMAMQPRFNEIGEKSHVLTPPKKRWEDSPWLNVGLTALCFTGLIAYALWAAGQI
jgi:hypothetical protein